jgi:tetratricopeptide (TPR) repeat protein
MARMLGQNSTFYEPLAESRVRVEKGLAIAQQDGNVAEIAYCLWRLAVLVFLSKDVIGAIPYYEQSLARYQALDDHFYQGYLLKDLGILYVTLGQSDRGETLIQQSLTLRRVISDPDGLGISLGAMGWISYNRGYYGEAEAYWQESDQVRRTARYFSGHASFQLAWLALFNRGDLDRAGLLAEELQRSAVAIGDGETKHRSLILRGFLVGMSEAYAACHQIFQQVLLLNFSYFPYTTSWEQIGLCLAACGLGDLPAARQHLQQVLKISLIHQWPPNAAKGLTFAAIIAAQSDKPERAAELLGLVFHHPLSPKGWLTQWPLITRLRAELVATLTPEHFQKAWQRGEKVDLLAAAKEQLAALTVEN